VERSVILREKILFFNPYAGILEHLKIERDFVRLASNSGFDVTFIRCSGIYRDLCSVMTAKKLTFSSQAKDKDSVCIQCRGLSSFSLQNDPSVFANIEDYVDQNITAKVNLLMSEIHIDNWFDFKLDNAYFGRLAAYEFLINNKLNSHIIPKFLWDELRSDIHNSLLTYFAALKYLANNEVDYVGVYNFLYGMNRAFVLAAEKMGVKTFSIQGNGFLYNVHGRYMVYGANNEYWYLNRSERWRQTHSNHIGLISVLRVLRHLNSLFKAKSVMTYSTAKVGNASQEIRQLWNIPSHKKITLLTTSSADEQFSFGFVGLIDSNHNNNLEFFKSNQDWINYTIDIFRSLPDRYLVIRIHPREFANKRESLNSEAGRSTLEFLRQLNLPKNVIVNEPSDGVSLYDLPQITDLILNSTSSVAMEFASLGIPSIIVSPSSLMAYPPELSLSAFTPESYRDLVVNPPTYNKKDLFAITIRWLHFKFADCSIKIPSFFSFFDRLYFGPLKRINSRNPKTFRFLYLGFSFMNTLLMKFDRREILEFSTISASSFKSSGSVTRLEERVASIAARKYLSKLKQ